MGGGATMRAVAKAAGIGVVNTGLRGTLLENPVSAASRSVGPPVAAIATTSAADPVKPVEAYDDSVKSSSEFDDWDFADFGGDFVVSDNKKMPRLVFGGAPTFEEAKEATSELKEVIGRAYLSSPVSPGFGSITQDSSLSHHQSSEVQHNKYCLAAENTVPTCAMQAFKFLNESPAVQAVVASIASDPNVWDSVLKNPDLQHYLLTQKNDFATQPLYPDAEESVVDADIHGDKSSVDFETSSKKGEFNEQEFHQKNELMKAWNNVKGLVADMVNNVSGFFQGIFGGNQSEKVSADTDIAPGFFEKALGPSLMGLVIMVIMVVVLKR